MSKLSELSRDVRLAARAMGRHGLAHAYGHVSARIDETHFLVTPRCPLGCVATGDAGVLVPLVGDLPDEALPEVRIHREIYRSRPEIGGVCRFQPPAVMALSTLGRTPRALHGLGTYFAPQPPLWLDVALVRNDDSARAVAVKMGQSSAIVLRGNGAVTAGANVAEAACFAFFLEDAARIELAATAVAGKGEPIAYTPNEVQQRAIRSGGLFDRMWQYLCAGDDEWQLEN